jgi:hypothetical protein
MPDDIQDTLHVKVRHYTGFEDGEGGVGHPYYSATCEEIVAVTDGTTWGELMRNLHKMLNAFLEGEDTVALYNLTPNPRIEVTMELPAGYEAWT